MIPVTNNTIERKITTQKIKAKLFSWKMLVGSRKLSTRPHTLMIVNHLHELEVLKYIRIPHLPLTVWISENESFIPNKI